MKKAFLVLSFLILSSCSGLRDAARSNELYQKYLDDDYQRIVSPETRADYEKVLQKETTTSANAIKKQLIMDTQETQAAKSKVIEDAAYKMRGGLSASDACSASLDSNARALRSKRELRSGREFSSDRNVGVGADWGFCVAPAQKIYDENISSLLDENNPIKSCEDWSLTRADKSWVNPKFYMRYNPLVDDGQKVSFLGKIQSVDKNSIFITQVRSEMAGFTYVEGAAALILFKKGSTHFVNADGIVIGNWIKGVGITSGKTTASNAFGQRTEVPVISAMCM